MSGVAFLTARVPSEVSRASLVADAPGLVGVSFIVDRRLVLGLCLVNFAVAVGLDAFGGGGV